MKAKSKMIRTATSYLFAMFILGEIFVAASTSVDVPDKTIASKRTESVVIVLANDIGKLALGENRFCVLFQSVSPTAGDLREVSVDFRLLVRRIEEEPIAAI